MQENLIVLQDKEPVEKESSREFGSCSNGCRVNGVPMSAELSAETESRPDNERIKRTTCRLDSKSISDFRKLSGAIVNHPYVQSGIVVMIIANAIMMGIGTFNFVTDSESVSNAFEIVDEVFLVMFTIELVLQFIHLGLKLFLDGWLVFDFVIIVVSWSSTSLQIIRTFRIFRALRLVTRVKVMKNLILAIVSVMPKLAAIFLLLILVFYIFAVMMTQLFKNLYKDQQTEADYFGSLELTLFTLFQIMTLDGWGEIARQVIHVYSWAWLPFTAFVAVSGFVIVNLMIAVICGAVSSLHDDMKAKIHGTFDEEEDYSQSTVQLNVRQQCEFIEAQVDELQRVQEQTMHTLQQITAKLQARKKAKLKGKPIDSAEPLTACPIK